MLRTLLLAVAIAAVPVCAQAQSPRVSKAEAQKVARIIRSDKAKTQTYCEINNVSDQMNLAYGKSAKKRSMSCLKKLTDWKKYLVLSMSH
jgi:hypothetical protein